MTEIQSLEQLFFYELRVLWSAEQLNAGWMRSILDKIVNLALKQNIALHLAETEEHISALELMCKYLAIQPEGVDNSGLQRILDDSYRLMSDSDQGTSVDRNILLTARKIDHYEVSGYGSAAYFAEILGYEGFTNRLRLTMAEEQNADTKLEFLSKHVLSQHSVPR